MKKFTPKEALEYSKKGCIEEWIHEFLTTSGKNEGLSTGLKRKKRFWIGPKEVSLSKLKRICGPESNMQYYDPKETWDKRVNKILKSINRGWKPPPLIIRCKSGKMTLADGNHRYEALKRKGLKKFWTITWYDSLNHLFKHNKVKPSVFFITGTSGSGKTTLVKTLKKELKSFVKVHDFDEGGVPEGADENWRKKRTNTWLKKAKKYKRQGNLL